MNYHNQSLNRPIHYCNFAVAVRSDLRIVCDNHDGFPASFKRRKISRNVYAHSPAECEGKLAEMIREMQAEITAQKLGAQ